MSALIKRFPPPGADPVSEGKTEIDAFGKRIDMMERAVERISNALQVLTRLEVHHEHTRENMTRLHADVARALDDAAADRGRLNALERQVPDALVKRLSQLESKIPGLERAARWVYGGITLLATTVLVQAYILIFNSGG